MSRQDLMNEFRQDAWLAFRLFRRSPVFFAAAALTLAIGIGANGAVFSILQATLFQRLPYRNPSELVMVWHTTANQMPSAGPLSIGARHRLTAQMVLDLRREATSQLDGIAAALLAQDTHAAELDLALGDRTVRLNGAGVTPNFFDLLGVSAARGRVFSDADEAGADPLIVLSDALWRRDFGADPAIIGRLITLMIGRGGESREPRTFTVVGILPRDFRFTYPNEVEAWALMRWADVEQYNSGLVAFTGVARLRPGLSIERARRRVAQLSIGEPQGAFEPAQDRMVFGLERMHDWVVGQTRPSLQLLGAVAALLLLITCVTVSNGLVVRIAERQQELAVRMALGAARPRLTRQLFTEGALLSIIGALVGTLLAAALQPVLRALLPESVPLVSEISVNWHIVAFGAAMAAVATVLAAIAPAWGGTRVDAAAMLTRAASSASAGRSAVRWRYGLVAGQAAIAAALLIFASLLLMSFWQLGRVPLGFDGDEVVTVDLLLLDGKYVPSGAITRFQDDLLERLRAIPGIADVGLTSAVPFRSDGRPIGIGRSGVGKTEVVRERAVDPGYFRVLRISPIRGRLISDTDREGTPPVTVISESFARKVFGAEDPIGQKIGSSPVMEVVGVVRDLHYVGGDKDPTPAIYLPRAQEPRPRVSIVARTRATASAASVVPAIRRAIHEVDPALPAMNFTTIDQLADASVANRRFYTVATVAFATIALVLTIVGLVVVVARAVAERRRDLAIRAALGATRAKLARVAARDALVAVGVGVATGLAGAYAGSVLLTQFLFHVTPRSAGTYAAVGLLLMTAASLAVWTPMRRFERASVATLLKSE